MIAPHPKRKILKEEHILISNIFRAFFLGKHSALSLLIGFLVSAIISIIHLLTLPKYHFNTFILFPLLHKIFSKKSVCYHITEPPEGCLVSHKSCWTGWKAKLQGSLSFILQSPSVFCPAYCRWKWCGQTTSAS